MASWRVILLSDTRYSALAMIVRAGGGALVEEFDARVTMILVDRACAVPRSLQSAARKNDTPVCNVSYVCARAHGVDY